VLFCVVLCCFVSEYTGGLIRGGGQASVEYLEYGDEEYWTSVKMIAQVNEVLDLIEAHLCQDFAKCIFKFDQSSNHKAMADDALNVKKMNRSAGGKAAKMRNGWYYVVDENGAKRRVEQKMTGEDGQPKGLENVLKERGLFDNIRGTGKSGKPILEDLQNALAACEDFQSQKCLLAETIEKRGHKCVFYPKYHCELSPIERFWCEHKRYIRSHCGMTLSSLRHRVQDGMDVVCAEQVPCLFRVLFFVFCVCSERCVR
jgi:hypothetical protein